MGSLQLPADMSDAESVADEIEGYVTGLLGLVDIAADPLSSREHILLSNLIHHSWNEGRGLDLMTLVGMIPSPPIRKLGVFDLDQFFPADDRMQLAMKLNGLLASPSFAAWAQGQPLDIDSMLFDADGRGRCAIVTTAHLSDDERQFVTSLILSKLVTWMRRQSGTTDLRALLYMDEVAGYLPPTAMPPTKKPIMTLMKQARAFGVGVVLSTQNPVDLDYKAMSNAGTWMIGRLQTDRDKARLLDGMASAAGSVDVAAIDATISGLAKREFVLRRAGKDQPEIFTTRWAMSYLRGPMTRDQIALVTPTGAADSAPAGTSVSAGRTADRPDDRSDRSDHRDDAGDATAGAAPAEALPSDQSVVAPEVADGIAVRWVDVAAPWLGDVGGDSRGTVREAAVVARVAVRYDETKADLVHDEEFEAVIFPLTDPADVSTLTAVDYDDRDLRADAPTGATYRLTDARIHTKTFFNEIERDLRDHLTRILSIEIPANTDLKLFGRPGEDEADVRHPMRAGRRRTRRRRHRQAARQVRGQGHQAARQDRCSRGPRRCRRRGGQGQEVVRVLLHRRLAARWPARREQVEDEDGGRPARRCRYRCTPAREHERIRPPSRCRREQGRSSGRAVRRTRDRTRRRRHGHHRTVGRRGSGDHLDDRGARAHRRQGHPPGAGLAARRLSPISSATLRAPCRRRDSNSH